MYYYAQKLYNVQGLSKKSKKSMRHKTKLIEKRSQEGIMPLKRSGGIQ